MYIYAKTDLLVAYGIAFMCALCCAIIGLRAFLTNNASYQKIFSTYLRATNSLSLRSQIGYGDTGSDPVPKVLARTGIALGQQADPIPSNQAQSNDDDVELHLLHCESFGVPLDVASSRISEDAPDIASCTEYEVSEPGDGTQASIDRSPGHQDIDTDLCQQTRHHHLDLQAPRDGSLRSMR